MAPASGTTHRPDGPRVVPECSVVIPLCNEEENLPPLHERLTTVLRSLAVPYEIVYVDDGSTDETRALIEQLVEESIHVRGVFLSRNFGHQAAISAGLEVASGRSVITMDGDMQDPPELIAQLVACWRDGYDIVYARRRSRQGSPVKRAAYATFYRLLRRLSEVPIPLDTGDFALMDRRVVETLNSLPERTRFIRGLRAWVGFRQTEVVYDRQDRQRGQTKYSWGRLVGLALDGIFGFSEVPLKAVTITGCLLILAAPASIACAACGIAPSWLDRSALVLGAALTLLGGIQLAGLGIVGEYAFRAYKEGRGRPLYVIAQRIGFESRSSTVPSVAHLIAEHRAAAGARRTSPKRIQDFISPLIIQESEP